MSKIFDNLTRKLASSTTRRQTLFIIGASLVAEALGLLHKRAAAQQGISSICGAGEVYYCGTTTSGVCCHRSLSKCCINKQGGSHCCPPLVRCCEDLQCIVGRRWCPEEKQVFGELASFTSSLSILISSINRVAPIILPPSPFTTSFILIGKLLSPLVKGNAIAFAGLALDPPDPNFTEVVQPVTPSLEQQPFTNQSRE